MKLIVDIPDDVYKRIIADKYAIYDRMYYSIKNGKPLDNLRADLEALHEPTEPHLVDYRYHRNDMLDMVLSVIERYKKGVSE